MAMMRCACQMALVRCACHQGILYALSWGGVKDKLQHIQHILCIFCILTFCIFCKSFISSQWWMDGRRTCLVSRAPMLALQQCLPVQLDQRWLPVTLPWPICFNMKNIQENMDCMTNICRKICEIWQKYVWMCPICNILHSAVCQICNICNRCMLFYILIYILHCILLHIVLHTLHILHIEICPICPKAAQEVTGGTPGGSWWRPGCPGWSSWSSSSESLYPARTAFSVQKCK